MKSWASSFLDEDFDMADKLFYQRLWVHQNECPGGCGWPADLCKCEALANIFQDSITHRELTPDECYGREVLRQAGICPECHEFEQECVCEDAADGVE